MKKHTKKILLIVLLCICIAVFFYAAYQILSTTLEYHEGNVSYRETAEKYVTESSEEATVNFVDLREDYPEAMSWIRIEGTRIDYPVAHGTDNQYYVRHLIDGTRNSNGSIFIDYRNAADLSDRNTIFYGHHMKSGAMFAALVKYQDIEFYHEHPQIELFLPEGNYIGEIYSAYITPADSKSFTLSFRDDAAYAKFLDMTMEKSMIDTGITVAPTDRIITLSTCTYEYDDARFVVHAKLRAAE